MVDKVWGQALVKKNGMKRASGEATMYRGRTAPRDHGAERRTVTIHRDRFSYPFTFQQPSFLFCFPCPVLLPRYTFLQEGLLHRFGNPFPLKGTA